MQWFLGYSDNNVKDIFELEIILKVTCIDNHCRRLHVSTSSLLAINSYSTKSRQCK